MSAQVPYNKHLKSEQVAEKLYLLKKQLCIIGFRSFQFTHYKVENATIEHILEYRFIFDDRNNLSNVDPGKVEEIESSIVSAIQNFGVTTLEGGISINVPFKILVIFSIILSLWVVWVVYILYKKSLSTFAIK